MARDDITIDIGARNKASAVLGKVGKDLKGFAKQASMTSLSLKDMFVGLGAAGLATAAIRGLTAELERLDAIAKTSRKIGVLSEDLVSLRFAAAEMAGMANRQVDTALQRMTRRLSEAADKTKQASLTMDGSVVQLSGVRKALEDVGLSAVRLNAMGPAAAIREIADAMKGIENPADQLRLAFQLFDSEGAAMVNVLRNGSEEIDVMKGKAEDLGLVFNDLRVAQIEATNDSIFELKSGFAALKQEVALGLAPELRSLSDVMGEIAASDTLKKWGTGLSTIRTATGAMLAEALLPGQLAPTVGAGKDPVAALFGMNREENPLTNLAQELSGVPEAERQSKLRNDILERQRQERIRKADEEVARNKADNLAESIFGSRAQVMERFRVDQRKIAGIDIGEELTAMLKPGKDVSKSFGQAIGSIGEDLKTQASLWIHKSMNANSGEQSMIGSMMGHAVSVFKDATDAELNTLSGKRSLMDQLNMGFSSVIESLKAVPDPSEVSDQWKPELWAKESRLKGGLSAARNPEDRMIAEMRKQNKEAADNTKQLKKELEGIGGAINELNGFFARFRGNHVEMVDN